MVLRRSSEVWNAVDNQRPVSVGRSKWQQSHAGLTAALQHIGLVLVTTETELSVMPIPVTKLGRRQSTLRKVVVSKDGNVSKPVIIDNLLTGHTALLTDTERRAVHERASVMSAARRPKGSTNTNLEEQKAIDDLHALLGADTVIQRVHLYEFRRADVAFRLNTDTGDDEAFVADQVKSATMDKRGCTQFATTVGMMLSILTSGLSVTCIGKTATGALSVVWLFHGESAVDTLQRFDARQAFTPRLHIKRKTCNEFTLAMNQVKFRFDIETSTTERTRLLAARVDMVRSSMRHSLRFWNEDISQVASINHRTEHASFAMTRAACEGVGVIVERLPDDNGSSVDFQVDHARIQDKVVANPEGSAVVGVRPQGSHPYNPDAVDVLQLTDIESGVVIAIPFRTVTAKGVVSTMTGKELLMRTWRLTLARRRAFAPYIFDLRTPSGVRRYVEACSTAKAVPALTDRDFHAKIVRDNPDCFKRKSCWKRKTEASLLV